MKDKQREIKFRGWHANTNRMVYFNQGNTYSYYKLELKHILLTDRNDWIPMQYVGLKDINGKDVYEGDILYYKGTLQTGDWRNDFWVTVKYQNGAFEPYRYPPIAEFEVIGNVYENPELLTNKKE